MNDELDARINDRLDAAEGALERIEDLTRQLLAELRAQPLDPATATPNPTPP